MVPVVADTAVLFYSRRAEITRFPVTEDFIFSTMMLND